MIGKEAQAEFLLEAMPYIEKYQNKILVVKYGGNAMTDDELKRSKESEELGFVGRIERVDTHIITSCLDAGYLPVISTVGYDDEGNIYNVNADTAASAIAGALKAESLILMTDVRGLLRSCDDESSLIKKVYVSDIPSLVKEGVISGGMIPKVHCCRDAIRNGVGRVFITDGRVKHSILLELLSDEGLGTMFVKGD